MESLEIIYYYDFKNNVVNPLVKPKEGLNLDLREIKKQEKEFSSNRTLDFDYESERQIFMIKVNYFKKLIEEGYSILEISSLLENDYLKYLEQGNKKVLWGLEKEIGALDYVKKSNKIITKKKTC